MEKVGLFNYHIVFLTVNFSWGMIRQAFLKILHTANRDQLIGVGTSIFKNSPDLNSSSAVSRGRHEYIFATF